jgi:thiol-disulfide isomerase/thioredoxin/YHS domain-containing protein
MLAQPKSFWRSAAGWALLVACVGSFPLPALAAPGGPRSEPGLHWQTDLEAAKQQAARENKLLLVHVWAPWCGPCKRMDKEVFNQASVVQALEPLYVCVKINTEEVPAAKKQFGIKSWPTDLVLTPDGRVLERTEGFKVASKYTADLTQFAAAAKGVPTTTLAKGTGELPPRRESLPLGDAPAPWAKERPAPAGGTPLAAGGYPPRDNSNYPPRDSRPAAPPAGASPAPTLPPGTPPLGLDGFCPVQLSYAMKQAEPSRRWTRGDVRWGAIHRGRLYLFAGATEQTSFLADPDRFAPVASGDDPVLALDQGRQVPGRREFGVMYGGRFYLFASESTLTQFAKNPERYTAEAIQARFTK